MEDNVSRNGTTDFLIGSWLKMLVRAKIILVCSQFVTDMKNIFHSIREYDVILYVSHYGSSIFRGMLWCIYKVLI